MTRESNRQWIARLYSEALDEGRGFRANERLRDFASRFTEAERQRRAGADVSADLAALRGDVVGAGFTWGIFRQVMLRRMKSPVAPAATTAPRA
ncbi:hypothetical protein FHW79_005358 [Azospirillum sp. OGB3]|uniref:hypothetical protein n=1 Tax=Azospirillum sp. OGB3 TaxID=2587012 RepID=UPI001605E4D0|nr:hypothetical protein [Azospirillum sp. OGB3]MBB3267693.1 hypothetical protein [Azospirillum sp. OGB3]